MYKSAHLIIKCEDNNYFEEHVVQFLTLYGNSMLPMGPLINKHFLVLISTFNSTNNGGKLNVEEYKVFTDDSV